MATNKKLDERRAAVLRFDWWMCKLCEEDIDAGSKFTKEDQKTQLLISHIKTRHRGSHDVDTSLDEKYLVLYFSPKIEPIQENATNNAEIRRNNAGLK